MRTDTSATLHAFVQDVFTTSAEIKQQAGSSMAESIVRAAEVIAEVYRHGGILYTCGNGGSSADAQHLVGEMVGRYHRERRPLAAVCLSVDPAALTCIANDFSYEEVFARQVTALITPRDVLLGISTSGRSENVNLAIQAATEKGAKTLALTGGDGGRLAGLVDVAIIAPARYTPRIQECHVTSLHALSELIEHLVLDMPLPPNANPQRDV